MASSSVSKSSIGAYQLKESNPRDSALLDEIRLECRTLCGWERETFPGSQPVSLTRKNLDTLKRIPINISFADVENTSLLDGELIIDAAGPAADTRTVRFLVYDAIHVKGRSVANETLLHRLKAAYVDLIRTRKAQKEDSFSIFVKDFFDVCHAASFVFPLGCRLPHECDGLIFTPADDPYKPGTCMRLLKWKPAHLNTVDFVIELLMGFEPDQLHAKLLPAVAGVQKFTGIWLARHGEMWNWLVQNRRSVNNKVVECGWDPEAYSFAPTSRTEYVESGEWSTQKGGWVLHRVRDDRTTPNDESVVQKVVNSIADGISIEELHVALQNVPKLKIPSHIGKRVHEASDETTRSKELRR